MNSVGMARGCLNGSGCSRETPEIAPFHLERCLPLGQSGTEHGNERRRASLSLCDDKETNAKRNDEVE